MAYDPTKHLIRVHGNRESIKGEDLYRRSAKGQVPVDRFLSFVPPMPDDDGCAEWMGSRDREGYGVFKVRAKNVLAHRVMWVVSQGPIPPGQSVLHRCDNRACVRPDHLFLGTQADNCRDRDQKGRAVSLRGDEHPCATLTRNTVRDIRRARAAGAAIGEISAQFGVKPGLAKRICAGTIWRDVAEEVPIDREAVRTLNRARGERSKRSTITEETAREILAACRAGTLTQAEIAARLNVSVHVVNGIHRRVTWKHLDGAR